MLFIFCSVEKKYYVNLLSLFKFGPVVQEEMLFKEKDYGQRTHGEQKPITIAHLEPSVQVSLKANIAFALA